MEQLYLDVQNGERFCTRDEACSCPFCGQMPTVQKWHGGGPRKRLVSCRREECAVGPSVTGSTLRRALGAWNTRGGIDVFKR